MEQNSIISYQPVSENENYDFPTFFLSKNGKSFYFKNISLNPNSLNFIIDNSNCSKTLFLKCLTGIEQPKEKPQDTTFLKYDIVYKPEFIQPKFIGTLKEFIIYKDLGSSYQFFKNLNILGLTNFMDQQIQSLPEEQKQLLSFLILLSTESLIYILDIPPKIIPNNTRISMINIFKSFCKNFDKIGIITENNKNIIEEFINHETDTVYEINKFSDNEFYGQCV